MADYCDPACPRIDDALIERLNAVHFIMDVAHVMLANPGMHNMIWHCMALITQKYNHGCLGKNGIQNPHWAMCRIPIPRAVRTFNGLSGGYYYGYMWSEVLALDMLSAFGDNLNNPEIGSTLSSNGFVARQPKKQLNW